MKHTKIYDFLTDEVKPIDIDFEQIGGHPSIEEYDYEHKNKDLDTDYCRARVFDNYFE